MEELTDKGFRLEGDGHWITRKSGNVLGFYPKGDVHIYKEKDLNSKKLLIVNHDGEGFFHVKDVVNYNTEVWAKVDFVYHSELPCEGLILEPKPTVSGWILLYTDSFDKQLSLGFYSRGC